MIHSWPNADGTQKIENTGPLTMKRMETVDEEFLAASLDFIDRQHRAGKPFFTWFNSTRMRPWCCKAAICARDRPTVCTQDRKSTRLNSSH